MGNISLCKFILPAFFLAFFYNPESTQCLICFYKRLKPHLEFFLSLECFEVKIPFPAINNTTFLPEKIPEIMRQVKPKKDFIGRKKISK